MRSTPSTRSSRFSRARPARRKAVSRSPVVPERARAARPSSARKRVVDLEPLRVGRLAEERRVDPVQAGELVDRRRDGRRRAGRRASRRGLRSRRRARRRGARPTAGRAGRRPRPEPRRGRRSAARRASPPVASNVSASAATVASETRMFPCAAKHGPVCAAGPVHALRAGVGRAPAVRRRRRRAAGGRGRRRPTVSRSTTSAAPRPVASSASPSGP